MLTSCPLKLGRGFAVKKLKDDEVTAEMVVSPQMLRKRAEAMREKAYEMLHVARDLENMAELFESSALPLIGKLICRAW